MAARPFNGSKYKTTQWAPAIFADNMMKLITDKYGASWRTTFTTEEYSAEFFHNTGVDILYEMEDIVQPWYEDEKNYSNTWHVNEEELSKFLYLTKVEFYKKNDEEARFHFQLFCALMIYGALDYYKKGVNSALNTVFLEVYSLACYYSERMNFKCDLISTSTEF